MEMVLPMNTGAEAVETAVKTARRWGYDVKGVPEDRAKIVTCERQLPRSHDHDRELLDRPERAGRVRAVHARLRPVPYGDGDALEAALADPDVVGVPRGADPGRGRRRWSRPTGYLRRARELCDANRVLLLADEIQSGLGRTGRTFACDHEGVRPDLYIVGKALGGGIVPLSAVVSRRDVLGVFRPGEHGTTFGGNPLACAIGLEVLRLLAHRRVPAPRSASSATALIERLRAEAPPAA